MKHPCGGSLSWHVLMHRYGPPLYVICWRCVSSLSIAASVDVDQLVCDQGALSPVCHETHALLGTTRSQLVPTFCARSLAHDFASFSGSQDVFGVKNQGG